MSEMQEYRAYLKGPDGHIEGRIDLLCADDDAAKERAKQLVNGQDIELWQRDRMIATFPSKPSRGEQARQVAEEYASDQREIIKKLHKQTN